MPVRGGNPLGPTIEVGELNISATDAQVLTYTGSAWAAGQSQRDMAQTVSFAAAAADTVRERLLFPFASSEITSITVAAIGTAPTAGTIAFQAGSGAGGGTLMSTATYSLSGLTANDDAAEDNFTAMTLLTAGTAVLQGDLGHGMTIEVVNVDAPISVLVVYGEQ
jgi:hypothetical protein